MSKIPPIKTLEEIRSYVSKNKKSKNKQALLHLIDTIIEEKANGNSHCAIITLKEDKARAFIEFDKHYKKS